MKQRKQQLNGVNCNVRLVNLKRNIVVLAGEKTQTGQTAPKKDPVLSKLDLKFFSTLRRDIRI
jgi:hypothetical protein